MERNYPVFTVTDKGERALRKGHPWVYSDELRLAEGSAAPADGELCDVRSRKGAYLGTGLYNSRSKIRVRILSRNANDRYDEGFFARRIAYALDYRMTVMGEQDFACCRLIFGEADGLPGVTVDRFGEVLSVQIASLGMEQRRDMLISLLVDALAARGVEIRTVCLRGDLALRAKEGLPLEKGYWRDMTGSGHTEICENGIRYDVDYYNGQKTGFFLDQKYNRAAAARLAHGRRVLDCFTHTGSFALNAAKGGAAAVTAVDVSEDALTVARENARRNGLSVDFVCADVFDLLTEMAKSGNPGYDFIILDPPAFTKSGATAAAAERGYKEINLKAMKLLPRGGYLATCSCSHFMPDERFRRMLASAAEDAAVSLRQIEARTQSPDHPILWNVPETDYLKFYLFQVV
ncbi:MAG: class I SAM-dependent rRNA methyltransferase [Clostridia bacterium]|nr:class I SAM-dependent rRNA methyltransferase [Clostridia bacterium]